MERIYRPPVVSREVTKEDIPALKHTREEWLRRSRKSTTQSYGDFCQERIAQLDETIKRLEEM